MLPDGTNENQAVVRWSLAAYLGVSGRDPEPLPYAQARARELVGRYEIDAMTVTIGTDGARLWLEVRIMPEVRAAADKELSRTTRRSRSACWAATRTST